MGRAGVKTVKASIKFSSLVPSAGGALWHPPFKDNLDPKQVEENVFWGIDFCYLEY